VPCCEIQPGVYICRPRGKWEPVPGRRRKRFWCFGCRKHLLHRRMVFRHRQPSWYDDWYQWECPQCHKEDVLFPGWEWRERED
jgi:hypothetical protein